VRAQSSNLWRFLFCAEGQNRTGDTWFLQVISPAFREIAPERKRDDIWLLPATNCSTQGPRAGLPRPLRRPQTVGSAEKRTRRAGIEVLMTSMARLDMDAVIRPLHPSRPRGRARPAASRVLTTGRLDSRGRSRSHRSRSRLWRLRPCGDVVSATVDPRIESQFGLTTKAGCHCLHLRSCHWRRVSHVVETERHATNDRTTG
jgi:hypothetical protein